MIGKALRQSRLQPDDASVLVHQIVREKIHQSLRMQRRLCGTAFVEQVQHRPAAIAVIAQYETDMAVDQALLRQVGAYARYQRDRRVGLVQCGRHAHRGRGCVGEFLRGGGFDFALRSGVRGQWQQQAQHRRQVRGLIR